MVAVVKTFYLEQKKQETEYLIKKITNQILKSPQAEIKMGTPLFSKHRKSAPRTSRQGVAILSFASISRGKTDSYRSIPSVNQPLLQ